MHRYYNITFIIFKLYNIMINISDSGQRTGLTDTYKQENNSSNKYNNIILVTYNVSV